MEQQKERVVVINFGGQNSQFIVRLIRKLGVYCELLSNRTTVEQLMENKPKGIILSGGSHAVESQLNQFVSTLLHHIDVPILTIGIELERERHTLSEKVFSCPTIDEHDSKQLETFVFETCGCEKNWDMETFIEDTIVALRQKVGEQKVLCALSGGVDSAVAATLVHRAIGSQLTCMFVDHGLLRKGEADSVMDTFADKFSMNVVKVDAKSRFLAKLRGITDPEVKRKNIGNEFIRVFEEEVSRFGDHEFLVQGTVYTDVIESGTDGKTAVKSHHNVGGLPEDLPFRLLEPLKLLFKDEVRQVGELLGLPEDIVWRQPFPGPGLAIRIIGEVTEERLRIVREADAILREEIRNAGLNRQIWQYFTVLTDLRSVGVTEGVRTYDYTVGIRAVNSVEGMSAEWARIPYDILDRISRRITNEVAGVNRVVYDITAKPPATIEWE